MKKLKTTEQENMSDKHYLESSDEESDNIQAVDWNPASWRERFAISEMAISAQQPIWPDQQVLGEVEANLASLPPLVFTGEIRQLRNELAEVCGGRAFVLQAGDCAESFDYALSRPRADSVRDRLKVFLQMALVMTFSSEVPIVKIGRIAGQFAKPRSMATESRQGIELPSFRGHMVNDIEFNQQARTPNPHRLIEAYQHSVSTLNLIRAFTSGGYASLKQIHAQNQEFVATSPVGQRYEKLANDIDSALRTMSALGIDQDIPQFKEVDLYTSHEGLILNYEQALTRKDSLNGDWYNCSGHMIWVGARTNQLHGPHIEFMRGINNPIGCKIGPDSTPAAILELCETLNPKRLPGRLTLISRMGADNVEKVLPALLEAVSKAGHPVVWQCDPMHGNTYTASNGKKTRHFETIMKEITGYFKAHEAIGTWPGGIHLEITGDDVTECIDGIELNEVDLEQSYETLCDPRLNSSQGLKLAFEISELLKSARDFKPST